MGKIRIGEIQKTPFDPDEIKYVASVNHNNVVSAHNLSDVLEYLIKEARAQGITVKISDDGQSARFIKE